LLIIDRLAALCDLLLGIAWMSHFQFLPIS
jgi:hypothetical protein